MSFQVQTCHQEGLLNIRCPHPAKQNWEVHYRQLILEERFLWLIPLAFLELLVHQLDLNVKMLKQNASILLYNLSAAKNVCCVGKFQFSNTYLRCVIPLASVTPKKETAASQPIRIALNLYTYKKNRLVTNSSFNAACAKQTFSS